jgi:hypothetical protein
MNINSIRNWLATKIAGSDKRCILEENAKINKLIEAKAFTGIKDDTMYLDGETIPDLVRSIFPEYLWDKFYNSGAMIGVSHIQILTEPKSGKLFVGRMGLYLYPSEGLVLETLTKESYYYDSTAELLQGITPDLLEKVKSLTVH